MQIILMCKEEAATSALSATRVQGEEVPDRHYEVVNHVMVLDGRPDVVLHHDADELLKNPLFRMPTPQEQEAYAAAQFQASQVQENEIPIANDEQSGQEEENAPDSPPAVSKQKASGG